jgi:formylglycine-generating enzyme
LKTDVFKAVIVVTCPHALTSKILKILSYPAHPDSKKNIYLASQILKTPTMHHLQTFKDNPFSFTMRHVEGGTFDMGSDDDEAYDDEKPVHSVNVGDFWMGVYPVTQDLWAIVMHDTDMPYPSDAKGENRPVENVSWEDITNVFLPKLNELTKDLRPEGSFYRLPTEAEWEFSAKGGKNCSNKPFKYAGSNKLNDVGWYGENSHKEIKPVGLKIPNFLGLYDMSGNVFEWCEDRWHDNYVGAPSDGRAWLGENEGTSRVLRGGDWFNDARHCRSVFRYINVPIERDTLIGFRLVLASLLV